MTADSGPAPMVPATDILALAEKWEAAMGPRVPIGHDGTCDGCAELKNLVASYPTPDSEPWLCQECDDEGRREIIDLRALLDAADTPRDERPTDQTVTGDRTDGPSGRGIPFPSEQPDNATPVTVCHNGHTDHDECDVGDCDSATPARVPVNDEAPPPVSAEEAWQAWIVETRSDRKVFIDSYDKAAFLAGWQAAKEDDRGN